MATSRLSTRRVDWRVQVGTNNKAAQGLVIFEASVTYIPDPLAAGGPRTAIPEPVPAVLDSSGYACTPDPANPARAGERGVNLFTTDSLGEDGGHWTWTARPQLRSVNGIQMANAIPSFSFAVPAGAGTLDLATVQKVPASPGIGEAQAVALLSQSKRDVDSVVARANAGEFKGDQGIPGVNAIPASQAVATYVSTPGNPVREALRTSFPHKGDALINGRDYGMKGDGTLEDPAALAAARDAAIQAGKPLYLPAGTYLLGAQWSLSTCPGLIGDGPSTVIKATHTAGRILDFNGGVGVVARAFSVLGAEAGIRNGTNHGIRFNACTNLTAEDITVSKTAASGMFLASVSRGIVRGIRVQDTLADGIHISEGSTDITVTGCVNTRTGDDGIAVVAYKKDAFRVKRVTITGNVISTTKTRGITNVGGEDVVISSNIIIDTGSQGILALLDVGWDTYPPLRTTIIGNMIRDTAVGRTTVTGHGIEAAAGAIDTIITGNQIENTNIRGIQLFAPADVTNNRIKRAGTIGIAVLPGADGTRISGNTVIESGATGISSGSGPVSNIQIVGNRVVDPNRNEITTADAYTLYEVTNAVFADNVSEHKGGLLDSAFEIASCTNVRIGQNLATGTVISMKVINNTDVSRVGYTGTSAPTGSQYVVGQQYTRTGVNELYVHAGAGTWARIAAA